LSPSLAAIKSTNPDSPGKVAVKMERAKTEGERENDLDTVNRVDDLSDSSR